MKRKWNTVPELIIGALVYLAVISIVAVVITIRDKKIAVANGKLEEKASSKSPKGKTSAGKNTKKTTGKKTPAKKSSSKTTKPQRRVPEKTLLIIAALGGSVAMLITMRTIRHKTQHMKFMLGIPAIIVAQCVLIVALVILL